jgi:hypothetical protein
VTLDAETGIPGEEVAARLGFLRSLRTWGVFLQRSLNSVPDVDGEALVEWLQQPREPIPIRAAAAHRPRRGDAAEPTLLDVRARAVGRPAPDEREEQPPPRVHSEIQAKLRDIGLYEGYDVWVADRGTEWEGEFLGQGCLERLPVIAADQTLRVMRNIDIIWFRHGTGHPYHFFEVEHSTSVYSGLLRFNDVMIDFPIPKAFIVGEDRIQARFEREISRRTFEHSGLRDVTFFLPYGDVRETWDRYRRLGVGSQAWGRGRSSPPESIDSAS